MMARSVIVGRRVMRQLLRDRRSLAVIVLQPLIIMGIFGYAFGGDVTGADVVVANLDRGTLAQDVLDALDRETADLFFVATEAQAEQAVLDGRVAVAVVFPTNFTEHLESARTGELETAYLTFYQDNTNTQLRGAVQEAFLDALADALEARTDEPAAFELDERVVFGSEDPVSLEFLVPGIAAYSIFMLGSMMTVVSIVKERAQGTMDRIMATPIARGEVVLGYAGAYGLLSIAQAAIVLAVALLVFDVHLRGSLALALLTTALVGVVALGLGIMVSGLATNETQAVQTVMFIAFPNLFLAGIFAPLEAMPRWMWPLSRLVPLTYAVEAMRAIVNRGAGLAAVLPQILILAGFALAFLLVATMTFRRKR